MQHCTSWTMGRRWWPQGGDTQVVHIQKHLLGGEIWNREPSNHPLVKAWRVLILSSGRHSSPQREPWESGLDVPIFNATDKYQKHMNSEEAQLECRRLTRIQENYMSCLDSFNSLTVGILISISTAQPEKKPSKGLLLPGLVLQGRPPAIRRSPTLAWHTRPSHTGHLLTFPNPFLTISIQAFRDCSLFLSSVVNSYSSFRCQLNYSFPPEVFCDSPSWVRCPHPCALMAQFVPLG